MAGCSGEDTKGTDTPIVQESGAGRLFHADGRPAAFATVRIYKVGEVPEPAAKKVAKEADAVLITRTDAQGNYKVGEIDNGEYNILANLDEDYAYQDSLALGRNSGPIPPDTLEDPAVVRGHVGIQPQHNPRTVTVQLLGTNRFVNVDDDGSFEFRELAGGAYTVRLFSTETEYTPTFSTFTAESGRETEIQDTLRLIFTGIPAVSGLKVEYDTVTGVAHLRWNKVKHALLQDYVIHRDAGEDAPALSGSLASVRDTVFADTLWESARERSASLLRYDDSTRKPFTWRIRPRLKTQAMGPFLQAFSLSTLSPKWVHTQASFRLTGPYEDVLTVRDTMPLVISFLNPLRKVTAIRWYDDEKDPPLREAKPLLTQGTDTLIFRSGAGASRPQMIVHLVDVSGLTTRALFTMRVYDDEPAVKAASSVAVPAFGDTVRLQGSATDLGRIVKWEWNLGGAWIPASKPDTTLAVSHVPKKGSAFASLRATDEDGNSATAAINLEVIPWKTLKPMPRPRRHFTATPVNGKIYLIGDPGNAVDAYDPETATWQTRAPIKRARFGHRTAVFGNEIMVVGGRDDAEIPIMTTEFYNTVTDTWRDGPDLISARAFFGLVKVGSRAYALEGDVPRGNKRNERVEVYDSATGRWSATGLVVSKPQSRFSYGMVGTRVHLVGGIPDWTFSRVYDLSIMAEATGNSLPYSSFFRANATYKDRILLAGGNFYHQGRSEHARFDEFDSKNGDLKPISPIRPGRVNAALTILDGKAYLLGGNSVDGNDTALDLFQELAVPLDSILPAP